MPIPSDIPGLIWLLDEPVTSSTDGDLIAAAPLVRSEGVFAVFSLTPTGPQAGTAVSFQGADDWTAFLHQDDDNWQLYNSNPPWSLASTPLTLDANGRSIGEFYISIGMGGMVRTVDGSAGSNSGMGDPTPSQTLLLGHRSGQWGVEARWSGTINKLAIYDQIPSTEDRDRLLAWAASEGPAGDTFDRQAAIVVASGLTALAGATRSRAAVVGAASALAAEASASRGRRARVGATSAAQARAARSIQRLASITAASSLRVNAGGTVRAQAEIIAASAVAARAQRIVTRGAAIIASSAAQAHAEAQRSSRVIISARSAITVRRQVQAVRAANMDAVSLIRAAAITIRPVTRFAFPGDQQGGTLSPSERGGILSPSRNMRL